MNKNYFVFHPNIQLHYKQLAIEYYKQKQLIKIILLQNDLLAMYIYYVPIKVDKHKHNVQH